MYEGKPMVLVVGGTDTGRTPMAAGLLRRALGAGVVVRTAGVLSHEGEGAMPEAQLALEQIGIDISRHISRPLRYTDNRNAELLLAIDRGTELVLFSEFRDDPRVSCLPVLANMPDVLDPHRMPLGVWISALRQLNDQVTAALPSIREKLGIADQDPLPFLPRKVERRRSPEPSGPYVLGTGHKMEWDRDEDMQRLMELINSPLAEDGEEFAAAAVETDVVGNAALAAPDWSIAGAVSEQQRSTAQWDEQGVEHRSFHTTAPILELDGEPEAPVADAVPEPTAPAVPEADRPTHVARMEKMLEVAADMPELVDWQRLRRELVNRLRAVAQQHSGALDFAPAATLMIEGKLMQYAQQPAADVFPHLASAVRQLADDVGASALAEIGRQLADL